jgi:hypothetical protein
MHSHHSLRIDFTVLSFRMQHAEQNETRIKRERQQGEPQSCSADASLAIGFVQLRDHGHYFTSGATSKL